MPTAIDPIVLASASPRRAELLRAAGIPFEVQPADVDETPWAHELPEAHVRRLAAAKAEAVHLRLPDRVILAADTIVVCDGRILGKPKDAADAREMLTMLSGRGHSVLTGVALVKDGVTHVAVEATDVWVAALSPDEIAVYIESGEPMDKAGAYAVQGLASRFVERIEGNYANVVGLPVARVYQLLTR